MRVHELAKELNINSKELLEFLSSKNEKIKTSSNSVSEDEIALAKKQFVKKEQKPVTENKPEFKEAKEVKETKEQTKEESAQAPKQDAPVKKKIVSVYNPQNSGRKDIRDSQRKNNNRDRNRNGSNDNRRNEKPIDRPQGIRPLERPQGAIRPSDRVNVKPDKQQGDRPARSGDRPYGDRNQGDRPQRNNDRPARNGGRFNDKFQGGKPEFNKEDNGSRPQRNNDRPARRDDRNSGAFDGADALKDREAKDQRNRDRENNRKKNNDFRDKTEKLENTKALEKNLLNKKKKEEADEDVIKTLILPDTLTIKELADKMKVQPTALVKNLFLKGQIVTINQDIDFATAEEIALEYNCICEHEVKVDVIAELLKDEDDPEDTLVPRPPVVCVMGHVDHGKTSLLDAIRSSKVTEKEAGGITQHIGAYSVTLKSGRKVTFLDTPGHEAFTAMRARGAQATDIAIIIIAADDSVMPTTKEAIAHAQAAGVPMVFAINKIDKPGANPDRIREDLANMNLLVEEWGGKYQCQEISAKKGIGVHDLLDKVLLEADMLDLKANPNRRATGTIIESSLDKGRGYVSTVLVANGTLKVGDIVLAGTSWGRVKAMFNERNANIKSAAPAEPAIILGLNGAPTAGDQFHVIETEQEAREIANKREQLQREQGLRTQKRLTLGDISHRIARGEFHELNVIVKGDTDGSVEALSDSFIKLSTEKVQVNVVNKAVGQISENDVMLASASDAVIVGFQVRPSADARKAADREGVEINTYSIIYDAIDDIKSAMVGMLDKVKKEIVTGQVEVKQTFKISKVGTIAGGLVTEGKVHAKDKARVIRDGIVIRTAEIGALKRYKDDVKEVVTGMECGLSLVNYNDIQEGDVIETFTEIEVEQKL